MKTPLLPFFLILALTFLVLLSQISDVHLVGGASSVELFFSPSTVLVGVQANFTIYVSLADCPPFNHFIITVAYNTTYLDALDAQVLVPWAYYTEIHEDFGLVDVYGWDDMLSLEGNQTLASIEFNAVANSNSTLELTDTELFDPQSDPIPHNVTSGQVEIVGPLEITAACIKQSYYLEQNVTVHGNVTIEGKPVSSLVGIEVDTPQGEVLVIRTVETGNLSSISWPIEMTSFYPSDDQSNLKGSFPAGFQSYFTVNVKNVANETLPLLISVNAYDKYNRPFGFSIMQGMLAPNATATLIGPILIPEEAANGTAMAYANVLSSWPRNGGFPYYPEQNATFQIFDGNLESSQALPQTDIDFQANYNLTFKLPTYEGLGNYSVYATSHYKVQEASGETLFLATLLGDFDGNGKVGPFDWAMFSVSYGSRPGYPNWLPEADFDNDEKIGPFDFAVFGLNFGKSIYR